MRLSKAILKQACAWQVRLDNEQTTPDDLAAFEAWLAADPRHVAASRRILHGAASLAAAHPFQRAHRSARPAANRRAFVIALAGAPAVAIAFGLAATAPKTYATAIGEQQTVMLGDGSTILLNTGTALSVRFSSDARRVTLRRGEAFFNVARDPGRPFMVDAHGRSLRAVGTQFAVRADPSAFDVLVVEGAVAVSAARARARAPVTSSHPPLLAGQLLDLASASTPVTLSSPEIQRRLAWRTGWVEFNGQPLSHAVREVARHTGVRFIVDPQVAETPVLGRFRANRLDSFLSSLANFEMLETERRGDEIHIRRRPVTE